MLHYTHVDVFSHRPLCGNGLTVFRSPHELPASLMQRVTQEMRQFESIFLVDTSQPRTVKARIFTMEEELGFAGHPVIGAACVLHDSDHPSADEVIWHFELPARTLIVVSHKRNGHYAAEMDQGVPVFGPPLAPESLVTVLAALNLEASDLALDVPTHVVSTGLPYLIVALRQGLERARILRPDFEKLLDAFGAKFVYVLDVAAREGRTWDNAGVVEDIATGSAAGPAGALLVRYGKAPEKVRFALHQGRFAGRPSELFARAEGSAQQVGSIHVLGQVAMVGRGRLEFDLGEMARG